MKWSLTAGSMPSRKTAAACGGGGFLLMAVVGGVYGLNALLLTRPDVAGLGATTALLPFAAASAGLAVGCALSGRTISRCGPRVAGAVGALLWASSVYVAGIIAESRHFGTAPVALAIGGVGVGLTYVTVSATVGSSFPNAPTIGAAIGPFGFASGAAIVMLSDAAFFSSPGLEHVAESLKWVGGVSAVVAGAAIRGLPRRGSIKSPVRRDRPRWMLALLLFANALPGMLLLAIYIPLLTQLASSPSVAKSEVLAAITFSALMLGGLLAPLLRDSLGPRRTFAILLVIRGVALLIAPIAGSTTAFVVLAAVILFGHGAGFGILAGLVRAQAHPQRFATDYGQVLVGWGVAGVAGTLAAAVTLSLCGTFTVAIVLSGLIALTGGVLVAYFGAEMFASADRLDAID